MWLVTFIDKYQHIIYTWSNQKLSLYKHLRSYLCIFSAIGDIMTSQMRCCVYDPQSHAYIFYIERFTIAWFGVSLASFAMHQTQSIHIFDAVVHCEIGGTQGLLGKTIRLCVVPKGLWVKLSYLNTVHMWLNTFVYNSFSMILMQRTSGWPKLECSSL